MFFTTKVSYYTVINYIITLLRGGWSRIIIKSRDLKEMLN